MSEHVQINNVLSYIQSSRDSLTKADISNAVEKFYKLDDISKSKDIIYDAIDKRPLQRRGAGRCVSEIQDILEAFDYADASTTIKLPMYAAFGKNALPPSSGYEYLKDALDLISNEITNMKSEIAQIKAQKSNEVNSHITTLFNDLEKKMKNDLLNTTNQLKSEISALCNGVAGQSSPSENGHPSILQSTEMHPKPGMSYSKKVKSNLQLQQKPSATTASHSSGVNNVQKRSHHNESSMPAGPQRAKRKKKTVMGTAELDENDGFVGIVRKADLFIGCGKAVTCDTIKNYCKNKLKVEFFNCSSLEARDKTNNYFKLELTLDQRDTLLDAKYWPKNTIIRKFYKRKSKSLNQNFEVSDVGNRGQNSTAELNG